MTEMLEFCSCGHLRDEHVAGGGCIHVNRGRGKLAHLGERLCSCTRFIFDDRLVSSEDFIAKVLEKARAKESIDLEPGEREEALQEMRISLWKAACKYDSRSHIRFGVYASFETYNDAIDHIRKVRGRHGQHRVFDARTRIEEHADGDTVGHGAPGSGRLDSSASRDPADDPDAWAADAGGLLTVGDGEAAEPAGSEGGGHATRPPHRDHRPVLPQARRGRAQSPAAARAAARLRPAYIDCHTCGWRNYLAPPKTVPGWSMPDNCGGCGLPLNH